MMNRRDAGKLAFAGAAAMAAFYGVKPAQTGALAVSNAGTGKNKLTSQRART